jgi:hypothetical protein
MIAFVRIIIEQEHGEIHFTRACSLGSLPLYFMTFSQLISLFSYFIAAIRSGVPLSGLYAAQFDLA